MGFPEAAIITGCKDGDLVAYFNIILFYIEISVVKSLYLRGNIASGWTSISHGMVPATSDENGICNIETNYHNIEIYMCIINEYAKG